MQIKNDTFLSGNPAILVEGVADDEFKVSPSYAVELGVRLLVAAQQSMHPTSETLRRLQASLTPEQLSALKVLLTPLTCG